MPKYAKIKLSHDNAGEHIAYWNLTKHNHAKSIDASKWAKKEFAAHFRVPEGEVRFSGYESGLSSPPSGANAWEIK
jgi:hypothetical protein